MNTSNRSKKVNLGEMNKESYSLSDVLDHIDCETLSHDDWIRAGMAIKHEGGTVQDWDAWSASDPQRYHPGECEKKWASFNGSANPVTMATLVKLAKDQGWEPDKRIRTKRPIVKRSWDDIVYLDEIDDTPVVDVAFLEDVPMETPGVDWDGRQDLIQYLEALFKPGDYVGYVISTFEKDGRKSPTSGTYSLTAGELIERLKKRDIDMALGEYDREVGGWIRFNPLDGQGAKDQNVTAYRYALVESDKMTIEQQAAIYDALELPIAALVHSGNKSLHAIVKVDATNLDEYKTRVRFLYDICKKNKLEVDNNNRNPSRLSRMPGLMRNGQKQYLVGLNKGKASWEEWKDYIDELNDSLPDFQSMDDVWDDLPPLAPELIRGILRQGHKMLLAGASKAGKSYMLLELAIAIAEGKQWLGWDVAQGKVLYVNLELDAISCMHRIKDLYQALEWAPLNRKNLEVWHLRGKALPLDVLAPKLVRRAQKGGFTAIILDPLYKVLTGDENSAHEMAKFCNNFDKICLELGVATIYCHHHSKGGQGHKSSKDRSSGSGVFARDPDALLDLIELNMDEDRRKAAVPLIQEVGYKICPTMSAWRIEGTLREFPPLAGTDIFFSHPVHFKDEWQVLKDAEPDSELPSWGGRKRGNKEKTLTGTEALEAAYNACKFHDADEPAMLGDIVDCAGVTEATIKRWLKNTSRFVLGKDNVVRTEKEHNAYETANAIEKAKDMTGTATVKAVADILGKSERQVRNRLTEMEITYKNGVISADGNRK